MLRHYSKWLAVFKSCFSKETHELPSIYLLSNAPILIELQVDMVNKFSTFIPDYLCKSIELFSYPHFYKSLTDYN